MSHSSTVLKGAASLAGDGSPEKSSHPKKLMPDAPRSVSPRWKTMKSSSLSIVLVAADNAFKLKRNLIRFVHQAHGRYSLPCAWLHYASRLN